MISERRYAFRQVEREKLIHDLFAFRMHKKVYDLQFFG